MPGGYQASFLESFCLPFLMDAQNPDGGWGYRLGFQSRVEPTAWALLALAQTAPPSGLESAARRAAAWLREAQLPDGSWPAQAQQREGCWVTALACLALHMQGGPPDAVTQGIAWLCDTWPREGSLWWRLRYRLLRGDSVVRQNLRLRGWSWTSGTSSWVEPTAYALIVLRNVPEKLHPRVAAKRRRLGEGMLYDRMCSGGGWDLGNPVVYGVAGQPRVGPTVWALLALQDHRDRIENQKSLDWLEHAYPQIQGPASLALANICLAAYGRPAPPLEPALRGLHLRNQYFHSVPVVAWAIIALRPSVDWLWRAPKESG